ncbi:protoporphyrinogen oxidase [Ophiocordyceps camponoti-floridani]|uniref:Protoporphyrinogen oxidase n=1 Tax=Ophiocordyceps camponoti-floridani TaxID=2030778 RepID=A0A8H4QAI0_9HYPO|nr:protoporphyrinogen oxidase [Ophiocordyceps camponoti-floridani]
MASPRTDWEQRISDLITESKKHDKIYSAPIGGYTVHVHPTVYSPKYFPETLWYGENLPEIVKGRSFLEVGIGSGLISLCVAASGSKVSGVDINPHAVDVARKNFAVNGQKGSFVVSDIFENVCGKFDCIFWNHPWQVDASIPKELKSEKTFDQGYRLLKRFVAEAEDYLEPDGCVLLGTSAYADLEAMEAIYDANGYTHSVVQQGTRSIGEGITEEYYIVELRRY